MVKLADEDDDIAESKKFLKIYDRDEILRRLKSVEDVLKDDMMDVIENMMYDHRDPVLDALYEYCEISGFPYDDATDILSYSAEVIFNDTHMRQRLDSHMQRLTTREP